MHGRKFTREFKLDVCRQMHSGAKRPGQICAEFGLAAPLVSVWRSEFKARGENAFTAKELPPPPPTASELQERVADLERLCGQLALENALLKKLGATLPSRSATE
jgi:transposase